MKELSEKSKQKLKLMLADKGMTNVEIDDFGNVIQVTPKTGIGAVFNRGVESGKIVTTLQTLSAEVLGIEYDPNAIVTEIVSKWVKDKA